MRLLARGRVIEFPRRALIMGIVNLSPDSFSNDGLASVDAAVAAARRMEIEGAEIIDVGAESARTDRGPISEREEIGRFATFLEQWRGEALLSINTWRPAVARAALARGGHLLNDLSGLPTADNARTCAETGAALLIMHSAGKPKIAHTHVRYGDILADLEAFFEAKLALAQSAGVSRDQVVIDPGIDFAKQREDNLRIYRGLNRLQRFDRPILLPVSRKTLIGEVLDLPAAADRDAGTVACIVQGLLRGAHIFRVHNVRAAVQTVRVIDAVTGKTDRSNA